MERWASGAYVMLRPEWPLPYCQHILVWLIGRGMKRGMPLPRGSHPFAKRAKESLTIPASVPVQVTNLANCVVRCRLDGEPIPSSCATIPAIGAGCGRADQKWNTAGWGQAAIGQSAQFGAWRQHLDRIAGVPMAGEPGSDRAAAAVGILRADPA